MCAQHLNHPKRVNRRWSGVAVLPLAISNLILSRRESGCFDPAQFLQSKRQGTRSTKLMVGLLMPIKEISMEYLILVAVVSMMALYALIIVGCLKQPEW
jgi:hypothetical protein